MIPRHSSNRKPLRERSLGAVAPRKASRPAAGLDLHEGEVEERTRSIDRRLRAIDAELREIRQRLAVIDRCLSRCVHHKRVFEDLQSKVLNRSQAGNYHVPAASVRVEFNKPGSRCGSGPVVRKPVRHRRR